jgi:AraC-like DNA-binding protein
MGVIATLLPHSAHLQRLRAAIRDRHRVVPCDNWGALERVCTDQPVRVAIVDLFGDASALDRVRSLKERLPRLTLIAYVTVANDRSHELFEAGRGGVDALVIADQDDAPRSLLAIVETAESRAMGSIVRRALQGTEPSVREATLLAVARAHERLSPEGLARLLALPRRTVSQRLSTAGFPPPQRLLTWGRLIVAGHLLEDAHRSADRVAVALDFPSGSAFRNTCQRYLHATPGEIRERGGAKYVIRTFLRQIQETQQAKHRPAVTPRQRGRTLSLAV